MAVDANALNAWESSQRDQKHARDPELETALRTLNDHLDKARHLLPRPEVPLRPAVFVVGCARGGSTLLMQWLASTGLVAYPTNLLSRFYKDPYVGALIHRVLFDLDHRGEVFPTKPDHGGFRSELGRTSGADAPHDFGYLWRNYFAFGERQSDLVHEPDPAKLKGLQSDVAALEMVFKKPVMLKAMEMNWHIPLLRSLFPNSVFLFIQRDIIAHASSLLHARRSFYGDERAWYSYKPAEYDAIKIEEPWEQVVSQVWHTNRAIRHSGEALPARDLIDVHYEYFCKHPGALHDLLADRLDVRSAYQGPQELAASAKPVSAEMTERAHRTIERLERR